ncbi:hypothetical protein [Cupriavidus sp. UYPR2.512]|uniref:hypothetical protein n=1 Tax=Cupriavidus sp. UYPR2.512 TaxID=1080187 RepID=UPI00036313CA|nr:hypothetical protein [Cupriavidus sp. UYPR2.512]UIF90903.1 hypothetical protein KAF44_32470 [Cupriavidus necator]
MELLKSLATLTAPKADDLLADANASHEIAHAMVIDSDEMFEFAGKELQDISTKISALEEKRMAITRPMDAAKKAVMALFSPAIERLTEGKVFINNGMLVYTRKKQAEAAEAQRKADAAAAAERAKIQQRAERAEASGKVEKAEDLRELAATTVAPVVRIEAAKVKGVSIKANWQFEVTDPSLIPREFLMVDEKKIGQVVKAMKEATNIPGIRVWDAGTVSARRFG